MGFNQTYLEVTGDIGILRNILGVNGIYCGYQDLLRVNQIYWELTGFIGS